MRSACSERGLMMLDSDAIPLFVRLACAFLAAFPAIAIWSRSRDAEWVLMILGMVLLVVDVLYAILVAVGIAAYNLAWIPGFPLLESLLTGVPLLLFGAGFTVFLWRR